MQIFEITKTTPVAEIDYSKTGGTGGGGFLRGLGSTVGIRAPEPDTQEPTKTLSQQVQDTEKYFDVAVDLLDRDPPASESTITARLTNRYGATKQQARDAIESAFKYLEKEELDKESDITQTRADPFSTMAHQLGKRQANPSRVVTPAPATKAATAPFATTPPTPEQIRIAKQRAAAAAADAATAAASPLDRMSPEQQRIAKQKFAGAMARAAMSNSVAPTVAAAPAGQPTATSDILQALTKLGYTQKDAAAAVKQLPPNISTSDAVKQILRGQKPVAESLSWSRGFDPSATLLKKMKSQ